MAARRGRWIVVAVVGVGGGKRELNSSERTVKRVKYCMIFVADMCLLVWCACVRVELV